MVKAFPEDIIRTESIFKYSVGIYVIMLFFQNLYVFQEKFQMLDDFFSLERSTFQIFNVCPSFYKTPL